jgi:hypothetical protein
MRVWRIRAAARAALTGGGATMEQPTPEPQANGGQPTPEQRATATFAAYVGRLLPGYLDELNESASKRLAFFGFLFGGISGLAIKEGLTPPQAHEVTMGVFCETLEISPMDAMRMIQYGLEAAADGQAWSDAARHGMDEFFAWQTDPITFAPSRLRGVLDRAPADAK